ncbi:Arginyl-tRNA--protein transferase 1 [Thecaphora frezii]
MSVDSSSSSHRRSSTGGGDGRVQGRRQLSILSPVGYSSSTCGYCTPPSSGRRSSTKSSRTYGLWAHRLSPYHYQQLVDRGWRRSGDYLYKPDLARTCCPQIPIRLDVAAFRPGKGQRRALANLIFYVRQNGRKPARWKGKWSRGRDWRAVQRWSEVEWHEGDPLAIPSVTSTLPVTSSAAATAKGKERSQNEARSATGPEPEPGTQRSWADTVAGPRTRKLQTILRPSSSTDEKYALFRKYQAKIHGEAEDKISPRKGWERFLVDTNLTPLWPTNGEALDDRQTAAWRDEVVDPDDPQQEIPYGCYHHEYRLDGQLIAVGVLDILPDCVSSVYLFYDPDFGHLEVGKISTLREIALTQQLSRKRGLESLRFYYLGFYIHACQKMKYKAEYKPCQLLDCADNEWRPFADVEAALEAGLRYGFAQAGGGDARLPSDRHPSGVDGSSRAVPDAAVGRASASESRASEGQEAEEGLDDEDDDLDSRIPTKPHPPPGMLDPHAILDPLAQARSGTPLRATREVAMLERALVLEAARQFDGIQLLAMSSLAKTYLQTGEGDEFVSAIEAVAALGDEELVSGCVLFL